MKRIAHATAAVRVEVRLGRAWREGRLDGELLGDTDPVKRTIVRDLGRLDKARHANGPLHVSTLASCLPQPVRAMFDLGAMAGDGLGARTRQTEWNAEALVKRATVPRSARSLGSGEFGKLWWSRVAGPAGDDTQGEVFAA